MSEPGQLKIQGLHHVTLIVRDLEATTGFYEGVLGLKLVDRETNADDPDAETAADEEHVPEPVGDEPSGAVN